VSLQNIKYLKQGLSKLTAAWPGIRSTLEAFEAYVGSLATVFQPLTPGEGVPGEALVNQTLDGSLFHAFESSIVENFSGGDGRESESMKSPNSIDLADNGGFSPFNFDLFNATQLSGGTTPIDLLRLLGMDAA
jgi:hypothetical protein